MTGMALVLAASSSRATTNYPQWWHDRSVINTNAGVTNNDYAAVNAGQLKWIATNAYDELETNLPWGAGTNVLNAVKDFSPTNNYYTVNLGQLKNLTKPKINPKIRIANILKIDW